MITSNKRSDNVSRTARTLLCAGGLTIAVLCRCASPVSAQSVGRMNAVLTDTEAYLLLPAELISGPLVERASVSPLGRDVAVLRSSIWISPENIPSAALPNPPRPRAEQELIFWNAGTRKPVSLWRSAYPDTQVTLSEWMPSTESVFAVIDRTIQPDAEHPGAQPVHEWKVLLLGLGIERAVVIPTPQIPGSIMQIEVSPLKPLAVLQFGSYSPRQSTAFVLIHPNGRVGARIAAPTASFVGLRWDALGNPVLVATERTPAFTRAYYGVDLRTGQIQALPKAPLWYVPARKATPVLPFQLVIRSLDLNLADAARHIQPLWLESRTKSESQRALITPDGSDASLLPDADGAIFHSQNALWFIPILKINKAQFLTARAAARRQVALSNAKQLGLAAIMYAQDNKEVLPGPDGVQANISPYLKNDSLFEGFTYTYPGGSLADIAAPAETILGYVSAPGGRAVLYADGHVKWSNE